MFINTHQNRMEIDAVQVEPFDTVQIAHFSHGRDKSSVVEKNGLKVACACHLIDLSIKFCLALTSSFYGVQLSWFPGQDSDGLRIETRRRSPACSAADRSLPVQLCR